MQTPIKRTSKLQVINTKKLFARRINVRKELAEEIRKNRKIAQITRLPKGLKEQMQQKAKATAKAFRNSQKKYGAEEAEKRRDLSQAIRERRHQIQAIKADSQRTQTMVQTKK